MRQGGWNLGGEQSGHIVMTDYATTGDGLIAALQFMAVLAESGKPASMLTRRFDPVPQLLRNLRYAPGVDLLAEAKVMAAIDAGARHAGRAWALADPQIGHRAFGPCHGRMRR